MNSLAILWAQYGPYHLARVAATIKQAGPLQVHAVELADQTSIYDWKASGASFLSGGFLAGSACAGGFES
jgi:hypothetical protein